MNALPFSNDFTGESQEQCACCKSWGWPKEEILRLYSGEVKTQICSTCLDDFQETWQHTIDSDTLNAEQANDLAVWIKDHETPMEEYLAEAKAELSARAFAALKRRIGV